MQHWALSFIVIAWHRIYCCCSVKINSAKWMELHFQFQSYTHTHTHQYRVLSYNNLYTMCRDQLSKMLGIATVLCSTPSEAIPCLLYAWITQICCCIHFKFQRWAEYSGKFSFLPSVSNGWVNNLLHGISLHIGPESELYRHFGLNKFDRKMKYFI